MIQEFENIRKWARIRGINPECTGHNPQMKYQRFLQEAVEIHEAMVLDDKDEQKDAVGDTIVTLINLAEDLGFLAEDGLQDAFKVIERRKGITKDGQFIRYNKLSDEDKEWCDEHQGNPGGQYFFESDLDNLEPEDFIQ